MRHGSNSRKYDVFSAVVVGLELGLFAAVGSDKDMPGWHIIGMGVAPANRIADSKMVVVAYILG